MNKITIHKNKGESFHCQFKVEGVDSKEITVRLCLEFSDNRNMFFYGEVDSQGNCVINIPVLNELKNKEGKLTVEAIADSMYFKLHECQVDIKNSVEIKMEGLLSKNDNLKSDIKLEKIYQEEKKEIKVEPLIIQEETKVPIKEEKVNPFVSPKENKVNPFLVRRESKLNPFIAPKEEWKPLTPQFPQRESEEIPTNDNGFSEYLRRRLS